jgi:hypothetical protein
LEGINGNRGYKVPYKGYKFAKGNKFDASIYKVIDPNYFYELIDVYEMDRKFKIVEDIGKDIISARVLQFYDNGCIRKFAKYEKTPDPEKEGLRGIIYKQGNKTKIDFFQGVSQDGDMGIVTHWVWVEGDKLFLLERSFSSVLSNEMTCYVYKKRIKYRRNGNNINPIGELPLGKVDENMSKPRHRFGGAYIGWGNYRVGINL